MLMEYSYNHNVAGVFFVIQNMAFVREAEQPLRECLACRSNVWIFSKELRARFQAVKVGIGLRGSPLLDGIVDDTFKITFRFVRELVAGAAPRHGLAIYPFAYFVDDGFSIADFSGLQVGDTFLD